MSIEYVLVSHEMKSQSRFNVSLDLPWIVTYSQ